MSSRRVLVVAICGVAAVLAGCGSPSDSSAGAPGVEVDEVGADSSANVAPEECTAQREAFEIGAEAYRAQYGLPPASEQQLVTQGYLREASATHDLDAQGQVLPAPGGGCEGAGGLDPGASQTVEAVTQSTPAADDSACELERRTLSIASEAYRAMKERTAADERELVSTGFLQEELLGYDLGPEGSVVASSGGPCEQYERNRPEPTVVERAPAEWDCPTSREVIEVALEAYVAQMGVPPVDEQALVVAGFLRELNEEHDLGPDGGVVAVPGGRCA